MRKLIMLFYINLIIIGQSYGQDSCFIKINQKYTLKNDSIAVSITFFRDSTYILRGEGVNDRWVGLGRWCKGSDKSIFIKPKTGGLQLNVHHTGRIFSIDNSNYFSLRDENIKIICEKHCVKIQIDHYLFRP